MNIIDVGLKFKTMTKRSGVINTLFFHHRMGDGDIKSIHIQHMNENGWCGIGYNWYIRKDGLIYKGRPIEYIPSGVKGFNSNSVHICLEGNFEKETPTQAQMLSVQEMIVYVKKLLPTLKYCYGHSDKMDTKCPAKNFPLSYVKSLFNNTSIEVEGEGRTISKENRYTKLFQIFYNQTTQTSLPLKVDGVNGELTKKAYIKMGELISQK